MLKILCSPVINYLVEIFFQFACFPLLIDLLIDFFEGKKLALGEVNENTSAVYATEGCVRRICFGSTGP